MELWHALLDVVVLLATAFIFGVLAERLRQSAIVGYLLAGMLLGPGVLNLVRHRETIAGMAELGVALLLFTIGLEFSWRRLKSLGAIAFGGGALQVLITALLVTFVCLMFGIRPLTAAALGLVIAPSSTACVLRMLVQRAELDSVHGRASLGILLFQDMALIPLVLLMSMLAVGGSLLGMITSVLWQALLAIFLLLAFSGLINFVLPRLFDAAALARNRELPLLLAVTTFLAASWGAHALKLSPVLGAFVAGVLIAESPYATWVRADVGALRTLFVTIFFASIGMLEDLVWIRDYWHWLLVFIPGVVVGKAAVVSLVGWMFQMSHRHAVAAGLCLAQIGEFSFVLAQVGRDGGVLDAGQFRLIVAGTVITLLLTPYLVAGALPVGRWWERLIGGSEPRDARESTAATEPLRDHVIIIGFGPAGAEVLRALSTAGVEAVLIDLNPRTIAAQKAEGLHAEVGDATQPELLEHVHVASAAAVVVTIPDHRTALEIVDRVRALAPEARIFARARYHVHAGELSAGVTRIVDEERETGRRLGREVLKDLGLRKREDNGPAGHA